MATQVSQNHICFLTQLGLYIAESMPHHSHNSYNRRLLLRSVLIYNEIKRCNDSSRDTVSALVKTNLGSHPSVSTCSPPSGCQAGVLYLLLIHFGDRWQPRYNTSVVDVQMQTGELGILGDAHCTQEDILGVV